MGCTNILKNAVGTIGMVIMLGICATPMIRIMICIIFYAIAAAISEIVTDEKIEKLLTHVKHTFQLLLAMTTSISMMAMIGVTIVIKLSGVN